MNMSKSLVPSLSLSLIDLNDQLEEANRPEGTSILDIQRQDRLAYAQLQLKALSKNTQLDRAQRKAARMTIYAEMSKCDPNLSPKTGMPYRRQTPAQALSSELNWDLAQVKGSSHQLQSIARKYKMIIPKIFFKDVPAADLVAGIEKELLERIAIRRKERIEEIKKNAPLDKGGEPA